MTMFIRLASVFNALEAALPHLSRDAGDTVRFLLDVIPEESRFLCFVPIGEGCLTELWAHYMYVEGREDVTTSASDTACVSEPSGWVAFPGPGAAASQVRRLAQTVEAFHFFAPFRELDELARVDEHLASTIAMLQRIRPDPTDELFGECLALIPPATFRAAAPGLIRIDDPMPPRPQGVPRYRVNAALLPNSWFVVLHAPGTRVEVDATFGLFGHP